MFLLFDQAIVEATIGWKLQGIQLCIRFSTRIIMSFQVAFNVKIDSSVIEGIKVKLVPNKEEFVQVHRGNEFSYEKLRRKQRTCSIA